MPVPVRGSILILVLARDRSRQFRVVIAPATHSAQVRAVPETLHSPPVCPGPVPALALGRPLLSLLPLFARIYPLLPAAQKLADTQHAADADADVATKANTPQTTPTQTTLPYPPDPSLPLAKSSRPPHSDPDAAT